MPSTFVGDPENDPPNLTIPSDGDKRKAGSVNSAFQPLADWVERLRIRNRAQRRQRQLPIDPVLAGNVCDIISMALTTGTINDILFLANDLTTATRYSFDGFSNDGGVGWAAGVALTANYRDYEGESLFVNTATGELYVLTVAGWNVTLNPVTTAFVAHNAAAGPLAAGFSNDPGLISGSTSGMIWTGTIYRFVTPAGGFTVATTPPVTGGDDITDFGRIDAGNLSNPGRWFCISESPDVFYTDDDGDTFTTGTQPSALQGRACAWLPKGGSDELGRGFGLLQSGGSVDLIETVDAITWTNANTKISDLWGNLSVGAGSLTKIRVLDDRTIVMLGSGDAGVKSNSIISHDGGQTFHHLDGVLGDQMTLQGVTRHLDRDWYCLRVGAPTDHFVAPTLG